MLWFETNFRTFLTCPLTRKNFSKKLIQYKGKSEFIDTFLFLKTGYVKAYVND